MFMISSYICSYIYNFPIYIYTYVHICVYIYTAPCCHIHTTLLSYSHTHVVLYHIVQVQPGQTRGGRFHSIIRKLNTFFEWSPPSAILPDKYCDTYFDNLSGILSDILSNVYSGILSRILSWHSIWHYIWRSRLRSGSSHWDLALAVAEMEEAEEVEQAEVEDEVGGMQLCLNLETLTWQVGEKGRLLG